MTRLTIVFILFCNSVVYCQNLVPNSSFEKVGEDANRNSCGHYDFSQMMLDWFVLPNSYPSVISLDHKEGFIQNPQVKTGSFAIGISTDKMKYVIDGKTEYRDRGEYIGVKLSRTMRPLRTYYVEYWIRRVDCANPKKDKDEVLNRNYGILFTTDSIRSEGQNMIVGQPQIVSDSQVVITTNKWEKVSKYIVPNQALNYLYIGQFTNAEKDLKDIMIGYYVIDDVVVEEVAGFESMNHEKELPIGSIIPLNYVYFKSGTAELADQESHVVLGQLASYLIAHPTLKIRIHGHTDSSGSEKFNVLLSENRAQYIAKVIIEHGVSENRIAWKGFGEVHPIAGNDHEYGKSKNRRVEFEIIQ